VLHVPLDFGIISLATNETLGVENSVFGIGGIGVLCRITNSATWHKNDEKDGKRECLQSLFVAKADPRGRDTVTLVIGNNLNASTALDTREEKDISNMFCIPF
jgi:hypothetical protein